MKKQEHNWTHERFARVSKYPTKPATSGFFHANVIDVRVARRWAIGLAFLAVLASINAWSGPSDAHAEAMVQADASQAAKEQPPEIIIQEVDMLLVQLEGERPKGISPEDWKAAQEAVRVLTGKTIKQEGGQQ